MNLIPFNVTIPPDKRDLELPVKLRAEWGGILQWAVEGCVEWQRTKLRPPKIVTDATKNYMESQDALGRWLDERCVLGKNNQQGSTDLFFDWRWWADKQNEFVGAQKTFSENLEARGFILARKKTGNYFVGLKTRSTTNARQQRRRERK